MPPELWAATITSNGKLTPPFEYIMGMRNAQERQAVQRPAGAPDDLRVQGSTLLSMTGHLFDYQIINQVLAFPFRTRAPTRILTQSTAAPAF